MAITFVHWQREELKVEHPDTLDPNEARALVVALFESGKVPPYSTASERTWGAEVETTSGRYRIFVHGGTVMVEVVDGQEPAGGLA